MTMLEIACREIDAARQASEHRRLADRRRRAVMSALDGVLAELEALSLAGRTRAPEGCRARVGTLIGQVFQLDAIPAVPGSVSRLMDAVYAAQDAALVARRRAVWRLDEEEDGRAPA